MQTDGLIMKRDTTIPAILCFAVIMMTACHDDNQRDKPDLTGCTVSACLDDNTLLFCDLSSGQYIQKKCKCNQANHACVRDELASAVKCTNDICLDETSLLVCDHETGDYTRKICPCDGHLNKCINDNEPSVHTRCYDNICKDKNTLLICDRNSGIQREFECDCDLQHNRCIEEEKCTQDICKDDTTLLVCDLFTGKTHEEPCHCDLTTNTCTKPEIKCDSDVCVDAQHLAKCDASTGKSTLVPCNHNELCTFGHCETKSFEDYTCTADTPPTCIGDSMYMICDDIAMDDNWKPVFHHCTEGRKCTNGRCVAGADSFECKTDVCKDIHTLNKCIEGNYIKTPCLSGQLCIHGACVDNQGLRTCSQDTDCGDIQIYTCYMNICYHKKTFELNIGDSCDAMEFEEYCKDNLEYKCGYDETVEVNACNAFNGCSVYIKPAYRTGKPTLNAICRGTDDELTECTRPGTSSQACYMYTDTEFDGAFSFSYNVQDQCIIGTDGQMIFTYMEIQNDCNGENRCDNLNGLCK